MEGMSLLRTARSKLEMPRRIGIRRLLWNSIWFKAQSNAHPLQNQLELLLYAGLEKFTLSSRKEMAIKPAGQKITTSLCHRDSEVSNILGKQ